MTNPAIIDSMNGRQFEYYCADFLRRNGYLNVQITQASGDNGVDILAERDGTTFAIQCKCYRGKVGNKAVQEVFSGRTYYNRNVAIVLTNSYFTEQAKNAARRTGVILWDRNTLLALDRNAFPPNAAFGNSPVLKDNGLSTSGNGSTVAKVIVFIIILVYLICYIPDQLNHKTDEERYIEKIEREEWVYPQLDDFEYEYVDGGILLGEYIGTE